ncbi:MAG: hypothetical protein U0804_28755 [Gemmataceae bacterium]
MADLPTSAVIRYGAYTFPSNVETTALHVRPQYDQAGRTVVYNEISISLRAVVTGTAIDAAVRAVTQILTKPAYQFVYTGSGYGLTVNVGGPKDVCWGPKPTEASVKPLGGGNAAELTFSVTVRIPDGPSARFDYAPMEFNFSLSYDVDASGYTTRTYTAFVRIPQTRPAPAARTLTDSADRLRESITPALLPGFRRSSQSAHLSDDKCRLDWTVVDTQMPPSTPPPGVVEAHASHSIHCLPGQYVKWQGHIEGTYEIARTGAATVAAARDAFFALVKDRVNYTLSHFGDGSTSELSNGGGSGGGGPRRLVVTPVSFSMAEPEIYGRTKAKFGLTYLVSDAFLPTMLQASGMWRPVPGSNWQRWVASLGPVLGPRGHAGLVFSPNDDRIVDLLQPVPPNLALAGNLNQQGRYAGPIPQGIFPDPTPDRSWVSYEMGVFVETDNGVVQVRTLPTKPRTAKGDVYGKPSAGGGVAAGAIGGAVAAIPGVLQQVFDANPVFFGPLKQAFLGDGGLDVKQTPQRRGRQGGALWLVGRAVRLKYSIPAPSASTWGDATLTPANRPDRGEGFWTGVVGNTLWPVHAARWRLRYAMDTVPGAGAPVVPNPLLGGGGAEAANLPANLGDVIGGAVAGAFKALG